MFSNQNIYIYTFPSPTIFMNKSLQSLCLTLILHSFMTPIFGQRVQIQSVPEWIIPVKYTDVKVNPRQISDGFYYKLSESQSHVEKKQYYLKEIRKIVSSEGVQSASEVSATFYPSYEKLYFHTLTVIRKGQIINKLNSKTFKVSANESESSQFLYNGSYTAQAILSDVRIGDEIEYSYTTEGRNPVFGNKYFCDIYLTSGALVGQYYTNLIYDSGRKLNSKSFNTPLAPKISSNGNLKVLEWSINNIIPSTTDNYLPAWTDVNPHIQFSEYQNWAEVVKWSMEVQKNTQSLSGNLKKEIQTLKEKAKGDQNKLVELATRMVQNDIRYTGIETGIHTHKPHAPSQVYAQKYGDCKDKSLLLASILQSCSIEANLVSIDTYWGKNLDKYLPSPGLFNHVVLQTKIDGKLFFIDPTMSNQGGNIKDNYFPDYGKGLITAPNITQLTDLPKSKSGKTNVFEEYKLGKIGKPSTLYVESKYTLDKADGMRASLAQYSFAELEESYIDFYQKQYKGTTVELKDSVQVFDDIVKNELTIKESYTINDAWTKTDSTSERYSASIYSYFLKNNLPDIDKIARKNPTALSFPSDVEYTSTVHFPSKWSLESEKYTLDRNAYFCDVESSYNDLDSTFTQRFNYHSKQDNIAPAQSAEYMADYKKISNSSGYDYTWDGNSTAQTSNKGINWYAFSVFTFLFIGLIMFYFIKFYPKNAPLTDEYPYAPSNFGGWLIIPLLSICVSPILMIYNLFEGESGFFVQDTWHLMDFTNKPISGHLLFSIEFLMNVILLANIIFVLVLFFNKRDILPHKIIWMFFVYNLFVQVLDTTMLAIDGFEIGYDSWKDLTRAAIAAAIWIPYFLNSQRVKQTFVNRFGS